MDCSDLISWEEEKNLKSLESFFTLKWGNTNLPSHDLDHHRRVWGNVKEILRYYENDEIDRILISNLLMASYFHDIGMATERGIRHGHRSRRYAEEYLSLNKLNRQDYCDGLNAIEYHDNKEYDNGAGDNMVLTILSVADDLDAFGNNGIWRYLEIYEARGIPKEKIGYPILENAASRFANFELFAADKPELYQKHKERYTILKRYFENYNSTYANSFPDQGN